MYLFQPKVIEKEKDLLCNQHQEQIEYVILDSQVSKHQRFLCNQCRQQNLSNAQIVDFQLLKQSFDIQQREKISQYEPIIQPHISCVEVFQKIIHNLKTRLIQQLDYLLWFSKDWINNLIDAITQYSIFGELDLLIQSQMSIIDPTSIIQRIKKIHKDCNLKIIPQLDSFNLQPEFKGFEEFQKQLSNLTQNQEIEIKLQSIQSEECSKNVDIYEILTQVQDIDESIFKEIIIILRKERITELLQFLSQTNNQKLYEFLTKKKKNLKNVKKIISKLTNILRNILDYHFSKNDYSKTSQKEKLNLIKKIASKKNIIDFLKFLVQLTKIDKKFIQCGSNALHLLVSLKVDLTDQSFENIRIMNTTLIGGNFIRCNFSGSEFENVDISGVNLNGALLVNCKWKKIKIQELNQLQGHDGLVLSVCFSPDGTTLASGSDDNSIRLWNIKTGQQKLKLDGHTSYVLSVCFSPDGITLASGSSDNSIRLWDVKTGLQKAQLNGHNDSVWSVCFSPDGTTLASVSDDNSVRLWNVKKRQQKVKLDGHSDDVNSVCFSPCGSTLASGSSDNSIRLWDVKTGLQKAQLNGHSDSVWSVCFSLCGSTLASGSSDNSIRLWDVKTGLQKAQLNGHSDSVWSVCFSPDKTTLASGADDNSIRLWDVKTGQQKAQLNGHSSYVQSVYFSPDGTTLASGSGDKSIRLWDVKTGQQRCQSDGNIDSAWSVCYSPDGTTLASDSKDNSISLWDVQTGQYIEPSDQKYNELLAQFKTPLNSNNYLAELNSNITILLISQQTLFQAQGALILQGQFEDQSGQDLKTLLEQKGSCFLENQYEK